jgi:uncharacterized protein YqeY
MYDMKTEKDPNFKNIYKVIVGELQRQPKKILTDPETIAILKKLIKYEEEKLEQQQIKTSKYLEILNSYIPKQVTEEELVKWIKENINFEKFKNSKQVIGVICKHFGTATTGKFVTELINKY